MNEQEQLNIVKEFAEKLLNSQKDTTPEFEKTFRTNYRKLLARFDGNGISTEVPLQYKCHVCGITLAYQLGDENFEHICQLCYSQRKERKEKNEYTTL